MVEVKELEEPTTPTRSEGILPAARVYFWLAVILFIVVMVSTAMAKWSVLVPVVVAVCFFLSLFSFVFFILASQKIREIDSRMWWIERTLGMLDR